MYTLARFYLGLVHTLAGFYLGLMHTLAGFHLGLVHTQAGFHLGLMHTLAGCLQITQAEAAVMEAPKPSIVWCRLPVFTDTYF